VWNSAREFSFGLDLDSPPGIQKPLHNHHRRRRIGVAKALAVGTTDPFPVGGIYDKESCSHDVFTGSAKGFDGLDDDLETAGRLYIGVTLNGLTLVVDRRCSGNAYSRATTDGAREPDQMFVCRRGMVPSTGYGIVVLFHLRLL